MKSLLLILLIAPICIRWLRWLAWFQQKEYRFDRLWIFIQTDQGQEELFGRLLPTKLDFSRTGLKRPKLTLRALVLALASSSLIYLMVYQAWELPFLFFSVVLLATHLSSPLAIFISNLPFSWAKSIYLWQLEQQARQKIQQKQPIVIGITGSYGKTTTKTLIAHLLSGQYSVFAPPKSHNNRHSIAQSIVENYHGQEMAVLEYAAYKAGEIKHLAESYQPDAAIITGLTDQHLAIFGSRERIVQAKAELIAALKPRDPIFFNGADPGSEQIVQAGLTEQSHNPQIDFSEQTAEGRSIQVSRVGINQQGQLKFSWQGRVIQTQLVGVHYLAAVKAAIAVGLYYNLEPELVRRKLESFIPPEFLIQVKTGLRGETVIDDGGTSNPQGFQAALQLASELKNQNKELGRILLITGGLVDLGQKTNLIHLQLAKQAKEIVDQVYYLWQPGKAQFEKLFGADCLTDKINVLTHYHSIEKNTLCLIEGRIPGWMRKEMF
ncbi:MAG: hypothetical protein GF381_02880 [Candidatus Pacebacteria bacterium]|nr:hypothetical protein [Candidatus Paceibacterota bacterium]